jgi:hypothetical protein
MLNAGFGLKIILLMCEEVRLALLDPVSYQSSIQRQIGKRIQFFP